MIESEGTGRVALEAYTWYPGILTVLLAVVALARKPWHEARQRSWVALAAFGLVGGLVPACGDRAVVFVRLALAALAAGVTHELGARLSPRRAQLRAVLQRWTPRPVRGVVLIAVCALGTAIVLGLRPAKLSTVAGWIAMLGQPLLAAFIVAAAASWIWLHWASRRWKQRIWMPLAVLLVAVDLAFMACFAVSDCRTARPAPAILETQPVGDLSVRGPAFFEDATQPGAVRYRQDAAATARLWVDTWPAKGKTDNGSGFDLTRVVIAQRALPGWQAFWHEHRIPVEETEFGWMAILAPIGLPVEIRWQYQTPGLWAGALISAATVLVLIGGIVLERRRRSGRAAL